MVALICQLNGLRESLRLLLLMLLHYRHEGDIALLQHHLLFVDEARQLLGLLLYQLVLPIAELAGLLGIALHKEAGTVLNQIVSLTLPITSVVTSRSLSRCPGMNREFDSGRRI